MPNILLIPNFLSDEECSFILRQHDIKSYQGNDMKYYDGSENVFNIKKMKLPDHIKNILSERLGFKSSQCHGCHLVYYPQHSYNALHADNSVIQGDKVTVVKEWTHTAVIFLNSDFDGGNLIYPDQGIEVTPKTGSLVLAPSDHLHMHMVSEVTRGERYSLVLRFVLDK